MESQPANVRRANQSSSADVAFDGFKLGTL